MRRLALVLVSSAAATAAACTPSAHPPPAHPTAAAAAHPAPPPPAPRVEPDDLPLPRVEVRLGAPPIDLPAVPALRVPPPNPDGTLTVRALRVDRDRLLDRDLAVAGIVTDVHDCLDAVRAPGESERAAQARIDADPALCERPWFRISDRTDELPLHSLWVVGLPAPDAHAHAKPSGPPYRLGDRVVVVGRFALASPSGDRTSDGLLVYRAMRNATAGWESPGGVTIPRVSPAAPRHPLAPRPFAPPPAITTRPAVAHGTRVAARLEIAAANRWLRAKQFGDAAQVFRSALDGWHGDHAAWFGLGAALSAAKDWRGAADAFRHAAALRPDVAMYQLWTGAALWEAANAAARDAQAARTGLPAGDVVPDLRGADLGEAWRHLQLAAAIEPRLWRAQYLIGKIADASGSPQLAAAAFTRAIADDPARQSPYVALANLYLRWDDLADAAAVCEQGVQRVPQDARIDAIWYDLALVRDAEHDPARALDAYGKALDARPALAYAHFHRGLDDALLGDVAHARTELMAFLASGATHQEVYVARARRTLAALAAPGHSSRRASTR